jgi:cytochrome c oxidase accessory protein FixG
MVAPVQEKSLLQAPEHVLSTMEQDGSRRWLYPKLSKGRFWTRRRAVAYLLIALFVLIPYLKIGGKPIILLDVMHRRFMLFGFTFLPTDTPLLALFAVSVLLTIFFLTALMGRVWCGWGCPQTIYLEFLYRPIERLFMGRTGVGGKPSKNVAAWRKIGMYATFAIASLFVANTFLAYFVGVEQLRTWVTESPSEHPAAFLVVLVTTALMLYNFGFFREQMCIIACPYGRFQSALLDKWSLIISYDRKRGEPRGAVQRKSLPVLNPHGDCVDCGMCVAVCPTGIDIRNGLQIECVGCAQCIDACDAVMKKLDRPLGLIRYSSESAMAGEKPKLLRPRVIIYPSIVAVLLGLIVFLIATHAATDVTLLRGLGLPFMTTETGEIENMMRVKMTNRSEHVQMLHVAVVDRSDVRAIASQDVVVLNPGQSWVEPVRVLAPAKAFLLGTLDVTLRISGKDIKIDRPCRLLGPIGAINQPPVTTQSGERHVQQ